MIPPYNADDNSLLFYYHGKGKQKTRLLFHPEHVALVRERCSELLSHERFVELCSDCLVFGLCEVDWSALTPEERTSLDAAGAVLPMHMESKDFHILLPELIVINEQRKPHTSMLGPIQPPFIISYDSVHQTRAIISPQSRHWRETLQLHRLIHEAKVPGLRSSLTFLRIGRHTL